MDTNIKSKDSWFRGVVFRGRAEKELEDDVVILKGTFLVIKDGSYSNMTWDGPVKVLRDFIKREIVAAFTLTGDRSADFLPWLIKIGVVEHVDHVHVWDIDPYYFRC